MCFCYISLFDIHVGSAQSGIEYIKNIVGEQFTEQDMIEALQNTNMNGQAALDYLLKKGN